MGCIEASEYTTGTVLGVHNSLEDCEQQCGVCCIPTCPSNLNSFKTTQEDGCVVQSLIPFEDSTSISINPIGQCSAGGYGDWWYIGPDGDNNNMSFNEVYVAYGGVPNPKWYGTQPANWTTLDPFNTNSWPPSFGRNYSLVRSGAKPNDLIWAPGYPNGDYFIETRTINAALNIGGAGVGAGYGIDDPDGELVAGITSSLVWSKTARKIKYFQCEDGILIDKTSEAFSNASADQLALGALNDGTPYNVVVGTKVDYEYTAWTAASPCFFAVNAGNLDPECCPGTSTDPNYVCSFCPDDTPCNDYISSGRTNADGPLDQYIGYLKEIPSYPSISEAGTEGATTLVYECNDTITQSGCLLGGVLNPAGVPLGIWHSGQNCTTFDCNA